MKDVILRDAPEIIIICAVVALSLPTVLELRMPHRINSPGYEQIRHPQKIPFRHLLLIGPVQVWEATPLPFLYRLP